jgi:hypothetical protein
MTETDKQQNVQYTDIFEYYRILRNIFSKKEKENSMYIVM